jgi:hypothetical protein
VSFTGTGGQAADSGIAASNVLTSLSGALLATGATIGATSQPQIFNNTINYPVSSGDSVGTLTVENGYAGVGSNIAIFIGINPAANTQLAFYPVAQYVSGLQAQRYDTGGSSTLDLNPRGGNVAIGGSGSAVTISNGTSQQSPCLADGTGGGVCGTGLAHSDYAHVEGTLFATNTMLGPVFAEPLQVHFKTIIVRLSGTISCTGAPVVSMMDLGTSPSTAFGSAIGSVAAVTTGTSDGVYQYSASVTMTPGDYYGFAFTGGTCVTAPTFDITAQVQ